ncbi:tRNA (5-methylaminomethyl-2-thiouridine)(34)-methyltransferase MnmD [Salegentibacter salegens]|uniref:tRNA U34 5-methylaminomethyl-2-thiouridine-forming methyltransferase MnmC n=1 Tax=Salegentibacter salegens TaxID=143223 RepID=A0A1M7NRK6_9FLAO|nr:tRNA (5-methylaminomethyl-2-thiouridine)(34)-methyltransferase MnmD [Salegentibacter salegens]PRX38712.1 tRNA U34 5-methylaminomethyl-2-thiouridine-forming methyltransferase MnmC [Salegentibacter salegens]SHN06483.1 tRNA U34 5-methylaminomethyl-2-thiouridine-forming methyltransferase MnmC [Salegentibacter salegens]
MERKIIKTGDGSVTIYLREWDEQYHSKHGAIQEALHVFIKMGLDYWVGLNKGKDLAILEIGFGTGLNAFISFLEAKKLQLKINYTGVEAYPVAKAEIKELNYAEMLSAENQIDSFQKMHQIPWNSLVDISENFQLEKQQKRFEEIKDKDEYDLVFFDAFGARVQPELWTEDIFNKMFAAMKANAVLVTYAAKGSVRRAMQTAGFIVERLPGPPGKREMLRALKK